MRLVNATTLKLEMFLDGREPPYAILSHTWGDDSDELTIRDVSEGRIDSEKSPSAGMLKMQGCCRQARKDGLGYVWIDTCCIDKTDLVELSEAINSMFRWYSRAAVCYAYLADVRDPGDQDPREKSSDFRCSRWFRRGWTLQELLAPKRLVFYGRGWKPLGTKARLCTVIESITGIPRLFLKGVDLQAASVAQRMSWAAKRDTKRKEDMAYCLLGIFGIAMPLIYGEGGDQAFIRLQEQIMRSTAGRDHSILAWGLGDNPVAPDPASTAKGVLATAPSDFVNSGSIVPRGQSHLDSLEISSGSLRISLPLITTPSGTIGLLNCGPQAEAGQAVGIPLIGVASGAANEYIRPRLQFPILWSTTPPNPQRQSIYIKTDSGANSQNPDQYFDYEEDNLADAGLSVIEVAPALRWDADRAIVISTIDSDPTLIRLRHKNDMARSLDFILVIELKQQGHHVEACHCLAVCSRDTPIESFTQPRLGELIEDASGKRSASNGLLGLEVTLSPVAGRPVFVIRVIVLPRPPDVTFDATARIYKSHLALAIEAALDAQGQWQELRHSIDYCDSSCDILSISGRPPLLWASESGNAEVVKMLLLEKGMNSSTVMWGIGIDMRDSESGRTALSLAAGGGYDTIVRLLLEQGADVDLQDKSKRTALSYAAEGGHETTVQLLFRSGAVNGNHGVTGWRLRQTLEGHDDSVWSIAFSHDSKLLASGSKDHAIRLWDTATGKLLRTLTGHHGGVWSVSFSHNSKLLVSISWEDHSIRIWDIRKGRLQQTLRGHTGDVWSAKFSHDSKLLASASMDNTARVWDVATGLVLQVLQGHSNGVWSIAFSHDSKLLASASMDHTVRIWNPTTGRLHWTLIGHKDGVWVVAFSNDSRLLASASTDHTIRLWDTTTGRLCQNLWGHQGEIWSIAFSHNANLLASASEDHSIRIWDTATGGLRHLFWNHRDSVCSVSFSHDSKLIVSASKDRTVRVWGTETGQLLQTLWGHNADVRAVIFSYDSSLLASASVDKTVRLWERVPSPS